MKKKLLLAGAVVVMAAAGVTAYSAHEAIQPSLLEANIMALTQDESSTGESDNRPHGRWRTVGCGGVGFEDWSTYCCPHDYYDNCPRQGDCLGTPIGC